MSELKKVFVTRSGREMLEKIFGKANYPKPLGICANCGAFVFEGERHSCESDGK